MSWSYSQRAAFLYGFALSACGVTPFTFGVDFEAEHQAQVNSIDVPANRLSSTEKAVQRQQVSRKR
jgi:hypothetical protein